jgi:hypothetical protein
MGAVAVLGGIWEIVFSRADSRLSRPREGQPANAGLQAALEACRAVDYVRRRRDHGKVTRLLITMVVDWLRDRCGQPVERYGALSERPVGNEAGAGEKGR